MKYIPLSQWSIIGITFLLCFTFACGGQAFSQTSEVASKQTPRQLEKAEKDQVLAIFEAAKTAKSATDYTEFLGQCDALLATKLSSKNQSYVQSVSAWAHNRRGELRLETAEQLQLAGNSQAAEVLASAIADFDTALKFDPQRARLWSSRGVALSLQGKYQAAIDDFTKVLELKPTDASAWFNRAEAHFAIGNYLAAVADYDAVLAMNETDLEALNGRGQAHFAMAKFPVALADFRAVANRLPNNGAIQINLGDTYQQLGRWQDAVDAYSIATTEANLKEEPSAIALQRMAWFKATCPNESFRDAKEAAALIDRAMKLDGETARNLDTLAAVQAANGNFELAKQSQQKAIQLASAEEAVSDRRTNAKHSDYQTRLTGYEESVPYQQADHKK